MLGRQAGTRRAGIVAAMVVALFGATGVGPVRAQVSPPSSTPVTSVASSTTAAPPTSSSSTSSTTVVPTSLAPPSTRSPAGADTSSSSTDVTPTTSGSGLPRGDDPPAGAPAASLSEKEVATFLGSLERTPASSTRPLLEALAPLRDLGLSADEVAMLGMGRFPVGAEAYYRDDFLEYRAGPPVHGHQGNDIWAAFGAPVRSPSDGVIRFEEGGLGGKGAYVTEPNGTYYYLAHLDSYAPGLTSGSPVSVGQLIAFNGDTGNAKGGPPHVHFEIHPFGGAAVNPKPILDQWLADATAAVSSLIASYLPTASGSRPVSAVGMARHFDGGLLSGGPRSSVEGGGSATDARARAEALVEPLTPTVLRGGPALPWG